MITLAAPRFSDEEIEIVAEILRSGQLVQGARVEAFERLLADFLGCDHAVACSSGTAALHLSLMAADCGRGDEVIVPDFTYPATANAVIATGATPVLVDIDPSTFNLDVARVPEKLTARTKALLPVHLFGRPAPMDSIRALAERHGLLVIEDAACALGASRGDRPCGTLSAAGCFSFHARKILTTGEGGAVTTDDGTLADRVRALRNHGIDTGAARPPSFVSHGLNYRMTEIQGGLGAAQMPRLREMLAHRVRIARRYDELLSPLDELTLPTAEPGATHAWQAYVVLLPDRETRDAVMRSLHDHDVQCTLGTYALSELPAFDGIRGDCPRSRDAFHRSLALPIHERLDEPSIREVVRCLKNAVRGAPARAKAAG